MIIQHDEIQKKVLNGLHLFNLYFFVVLEKFFFFFISCYSLFRDNYFIFNEKKSHEKSMCL
jgi:hypothetical protein